MIEYACIFNVLTTGNTLPGGNNCPIQFANTIIKLDDSKVEFVQNKELIITPDEKILSSTVAYSGIDNLQNDVKETNLTNELEYIFRLLDEIVKKNIYLITWNFLDNTHDNLKNNIKRILNKNIDISSYSRLIDVKKFSTLTMPICDIGEYTLDSVYTRLYGLNKFTNDIRLKRWNESFCKTTNQQILDILGKLMQHANFSTFKQVMTFLNEPHEIERMTFGKYKNYKIKDILAKDLDYLHWLLACKEIMNRDPDLKHTIVKVLNDV